MKYCPYCGKEIKKGANFCGNCGASINVENNNQNIDNKDNSNENTSKSRIVAGVLGICLGGLGVHNFYLGYKDKGIAQLLITLLSCTLFSPISVIWGLIEGILILTGTINVDATGKKLID